MTMHQHGGWLCGGRLCDVVSPIKKPSTRRTSHLGLSEVVPVDSGPEMIESNESSEDFHSQRSSNKSRKTYSSNFEKESSRSGVQSVSNDRKTSETKSALSESVPQHIDVLVNKLIDANLAPYNVKSNLKSLELIQAFLNSITHVRFHEFLHDLWIVFAFFVTNYKIDNCVFFSPKISKNSKRTTKSTHWLLILLEIFIYQFTGKKKTLRTVQNIRRLTTSDCFVYIDDMAYSGLQMYQELTESEYSFNRYVVLLPYIGPQAYKRVCELVNKKKSTLQPKLLSFDLIYMKNFNSFQKIVQQNYNIKALVTFLYFLIIKFRIKSQHGRS